MFSELFVKWLKDTSKTGLGKISNSIDQLHWLQQVKQHTLQVVQQFIALSR